MPAATGPTTASATRTSPRCAAREQAAMAAFGADGRCLMRALQEELDDPRRRTAASARSARGRASPVRWTPRWCATRRCTCARARSSSTSRRWRPDADGKMQQAARRRARRGGPRARAARRRRLGPAGAGRAAGGPLRRRARRGRGRGRPRPGSAPVAWVAAMPSLRTGDLGAGLRAPARRGARPAVRRVLERVGDNPPQREMANSAQQVANVRGEFARRRRRAAGRAACSSTTSASAAGRSPWSPASCAATAPAVYPLAFSHRLLGASPTAACGGPSRSRTTCRR